MAISETDLALLDVKFAAVLPHLDERQRRLYLAAEADALGHGGIVVVARLAGVSESTITRGRLELASGAPVLAGCAVPVADASRLLSVARAWCQRLRR
ncbi:hypothetical protein GCM10020220_006340 [Nonomuraea rubra]